MSPRVSRSSVLFLTCLSAARAVAQEDTGARIGPKPIGQNDAKAAARAGAFLRHTETATTATHSVIAETHAGYDTARQGGGAEGRAEAVVFSDARGTQTHGVPLGVALFGGGDYAAGRDGRTDLAAGFGGLKLQPLFQETVGVDASLAVSYHSQGFSLRPVVVSELLVGRHFGETQLLLNVGYAQPTDSDERSGSARAAVMTRLVDQLRLGMDSKVNVDLELDAEEPSGEPELEVLAGPALNYAIGHVSLTATGGFSALRYRDDTRTFTGVAAGLGVGGAF